MSDFFFMCAMVAVGLAGFSAEIYGVMEWLNLYNPSPLELVIMLCACLALDCFVAALVTLKTK